MATARSLLSVSQGSHFVLPQRFFAGRERDDDSEDLGWAGFVCDPVAWGYGGGDYG